MLRFDGNLVPRVLWVISKMAGLPSTPPFEILDPPLYPDLEKLAHVIQRGLLGFIAKNIEGESTEANNISLIL